MFTSHSCHNDLYKRFGWLCHFPACLKSSRISLHPDNRHSTAYCNLELLIYASLPPSHPGHSRFHLLPASTQTFHTQSFLCAPSLLQPSVLDKSHHLAFMNVTTICSSDTFLSQLPFPQESFIWLPD